MQREHLCIAVLTVLNGLSFMDRNTIAGVLTDVKKYFDINDAESGAIQTVFFGFYMVSAPVFGYLGDRLNRKRVIIAGLIIWNVAVLGSSFCKGTMFPLFMILRGCVGIGEGCFSIIAPTMIADYFSGPSRSKMYMIFYSATGLGSSFSGLGFVVGSNVANAAHDWKWGLRVGPCVGVVVLLAFILIIYEPKRGSKEVETSKEEVELVNESSYWSDVKDIMTTPTFVISTIANTMNVFVGGTMSWWSPTEFQNARAYYKDLNSTSDLTSSEKDQITLIFGAVTCVASLVGVLIGTITAGALKSGRISLPGDWSARADPLLCAIGAFVGAPCLLAALLCVKNTITVSYIMVFFMICGLSFPWALATEVMINVVIPQRRNVASAWRIMFGHLLGDAAGPYIVGQVSDWIRQGGSSPRDHFYSLLKALLIPDILLGLSGVFFLLTCFTLLRDIQKVKDRIKEAELIRELACANRVDDVIKTTVVTDSMDKQIDVQ